MQPSMRYQSGDTLLHSLDPRSKLFGILVLSIVLSASSAPLIFLGGLFALSMSHITGLGIGGIIRDIKPLLFIFLLAGIAQIITNPVIPGIIEGITVAARFSVIVLLSYLFTSTTKPGDIKLALESILRPIPIVNESDWATMFSTSFRFFPLMFVEARRVREAQKSRLGDSGLRGRIYSFILPYFSRAFLKADTLALAMSSRAYSSDRTNLYSIRFNSIDIAAVIIVSFFSALALIYELGFTM